MDDATTAREAEDRLRLAGVDNLRDVAGAGHPTSDGRRMRRGVHYRSNELRLSGDEHDLLAGLGLTALIDLRSRLEIDRHPDPVLPGVAALHYDAAGIPMERLALLATHDEAVALMDDVYRTFVTEERSRAAFGAVLRQLAEGGPQLFHCSAGKDRTGWVAALLLHIAGVAEDVVVADYLESNERTAASRARVEAEIAAHLGAERVAVYEPTLVVAEEYLRTAWAHAEERYGGLDGYLRDGLGLDGDVIARLRALLVE